MSGEARRAGLCARKGGWVALFVLGLFPRSGGGGGGGGGGSGSSDAYLLSTDTITFSAIQGGAAPASQKVVVTVNGGSVFVATSQLGGGFGHQFQITGPTTGEITITPDAPTGSGTIGGSITVRGCSSVTCLVQTWPAARRPSTLFTTLLYPRPSPAPHPESRLSPARPLPCPLQGY
jgi:hypothetical protein